MKPRFRARALAAEPYDDTTTINQTSLSAALTAEHMQLK